VPASDSGGGVDVCRCGASQCRRLGQTLADAARQLRLMLAGAAATV